MQAYMVISESSDREDTKRDVRESRDLISIYPNEIAALKAANKENEKLDYDYPRRYKVIECCINFTTEHKTMLKIEVEREVKISYTEFSL